MKLTVGLRMLPHCKTADYCGDQVLPPHGNRPVHRWTATAQDTIFFVRICHPWRKTVQGLRAGRVGTGIFERIFAQSTLEQEEAAGK